MRVLITGGRSSISNRSPQNRNFECSVWAVARACEILGYACDVRVVVAGEDLSGYDALFVEIPNPSWVTARYAAGALWTLRQREDAVALYTHLDPRALFGGLRKLVEDPTLLERRKNVYERKYLSDVMVAAALLLSGSGPWRNLTHAHPWGDRRLLLDDCPFDDIITFDPSNLLPTVDPTLTFAPRERERHWIHAAWEDQRKWIAAQDLRWNVETYGRRSNGAIAKLSLPELMNRYAERWGALVHPYPHAGSGYFRSRLVHALRGGALLGVNEKDAASMNEDLFPPPREVEEWEARELDDIAAAQREWYRENSWSAEHAAVCLSVLMRRG